MAILRQPSGVSQPPTPSDISKAGSDSDLGAGVSAEVGAPPRGPLSHLTA